MKPLLQARDIGVGNPRNPRLSGIDLQLLAGERLALLGMNGAGKSTLLQILAGVVAPSAGEVRILGRHLDEAGSSPRRHVGFLPQKVALYPELTVRENLHWAGMLRGLRGAALDAAIAHALERMQLTGFTRRLAGRLSTGMAQRLGLAQAVLHEPEILILDEPTAGLDPAQTEQIRDLLDSLSAERSLILATHLLDDVQRLCNRVMLLEAGRLTASHEVDAKTDLLAYFRQRSQPAGSGSRL